MHKELNPELFGERRVSTGSKMDTMSDNSGMNFLNTDRQIHELKLQNQALNDQMNKIVGTVNELIKTSNIKFEKQAQLVARLEQSHNGLATEAGHKLNVFSQRLNERKTLDAKVHEMVDRHNNVVKSFEVRMNQLQKLLADKEAQMVVCQTALNEAKMEIARLKRL